MPCLVLTTPLLTRVDPTLQHSDKQIRHKNIISFLLYQHVLETSAIVPLLEQISHWKMMLVWFLPVSAMPIPSFLFLLAEAPTHCPAKLYR